MTPKEEDHKVRNVTGSMRGVLTCPKPLPRMSVGKVPKL